MKPSGNIIKNLALAVILGLAETACATPISKTPEGPPITAVQLATATIDILNPSLYPILTNYPELESFQLRQFKKVGQLDILNFSPEIRVNPQGVSELEGFLASLDGSPYNFTIIDGNITTFMTIYLGIRSEQEDVGDKTIIIVPSDAPPGPGTGEDHEIHFEYDNQGRTIMSSYVRLPDMVNDPDASQRANFRFVLQKCLQDLVVGAPEDLPLTENQRYEYLFAVQLGLCRSIGFAFDQFGNYERYSYEISHLTPLKINGMSVFYPPLSEKSFNNIPFTPSLIQIAR